MKREYKMWALVDAKGHYADGRITTPLPAVWATRRRAEQESYVGETPVRVKLTIEPLEEKR